MTNPPKPPSPNERGLIERLVSFFRPQSGKPPEPYNAADAPTLYERPSGFVPPPRPPSMGGPLPPRPAAIPEPPPLKDPTAPPLYPLDHQSPEE